MCSPPDYQIILLYSQLHWNHEYREAIQARNPTLDVTGQLNIAIATGYYLMHIIESLIRVCPLQLYHLFIDNFQVINFDCTNTISYTFLNLQYQINSESHIVVLELLSCLLLLGAGH